MKHVSPETFVGPITAGLIAGRKRIEKGWCQRKFINDLGSYCALGAVGRTGATLTLQPVEYFLYKALPESWFSVIKYNDSPNTTKADILALYDRAIELARKDGA